MEAHCPQLRPLVCGPSSFVPFLPLPKKAMYKPHRNALNTQIRKETHTPRLSTSNDASTANIEQPRGRWFAVNMGTGIVSATLHNLPYNGPWLQYISYIFFGLNVLLFVTFLGLSIARYTMYPRLWGAMIAHPGQSLFLGCFPMGFASTFI